MSICVAVSVTPKLAVLPQLIKTRAAVQPDAAAILSSGRQVTYSELNEAANRFACLLLDAGVRPGTVVGVFMERSPESLAALLGIWKAGAAYLALDPGSPPERLAFMLHDAEVPLVIAEERLVSLLPADAAQVLSAERALTGSFPNPAHTEFAGSPDDLAYVLYTSGSTGKPKGVEVCHGGLANVVTAIADELQLGPGEVLLGHFSVGFDVANLETYLPLVSGGSLYIAESGRAGDGARLIRALDESGATTMLGTCSLWRLLLDAGWKGKRDLRVVSGGEVLSFELAKSLCGRSAGVWNQYGPTEATICSTTARIDPATDRMTIGRPISNVTVHILDSKLQPAAAETAGELYIGGLGVARGYRNRPELTAASFLPDPFSSESNARLYKTGDLARRLPDGRLEFLGRTDNQVKIHGYRIELEEIEGHLLQFPGVNAAVVAALDTGRQDRRLVAWFESKHAIPAAPVREFLRKRLSAYMVPSEFRHLNSLPLTQNGKVDRQSLCAGYSATPAHPEMVAGPENEAESRLRAIWEELLQVSPIGLTDSFFDAGGDSLLAALLVTQIERHFGHKITPDALIECQDIKSLAARIMAKEENTGWRPLVPLRAEGSRPPLFIVHGLGGSILLFRSLAARLGQDQPVYGVTLPSGAVANRNQLEIKTLASKCMDEIRRLSPRGPYYLSGHSFGALIAFEMAMQLARKGAPVGLLALLDADRNLAKPADRAPGDRRWPSLAMRRCKAKLKSLTEKGLAEVIRRRVEHMRLHSRVKLAQRAAEGEFPDRSFDAKELLVLAAAGYQPPAYAGSAVLFRAKDEVRSEAAAALGWAELVRIGLEIVDIPGNHLTLFDEPNVAVLAAELRKRLGS